MKDLKSKAIDIKGKYLILRINGKLIAEHRFVIEESIGRKLKTNEAIHHKNGNRHDNRLDNLELLDRSEHAKMHAIRRGLGKDRIGISPINKTKESIRKEIKELRSQGYLLKDIQEVIGLSWPTIVKYAK